MNQFPSATKADDLGRLHRALDGREGPDQQLLSTIGLEWICTLLRKNADYGSTVFNPPQLAKSLSSGSAILVRMSDKIDRLVNLMSNRRPEVEESIEDTMSDLGAYALLYLCVRRRDNEKRIPTLEGGNK